MEVVTPAFPGQSCTTGDDASGVTVCDFRGLLSSSADLVVNEANGTMLTTIKNPVPVTAASTSACDSSSSTTLNVPAFTWPTDTTVASHVSAAKTQLTGQWAQTNCTKHISADGSYKKTISFDGRNMTIVQTSFKDASCNDPDASDTSDHSIEYAFDVIAASDLPKPLNASHLPETPVFLKLTAQAKPATVSYDFFYPEHMLLGAMVSDAVNGCPASVVCPLSDLEVTYETFRK